MKILQYAMFLSLFVATTTAVLVAIPSSRKKAQEFFAKEYRKVLSSVSGDALGNGTVIKVIKVSTHNGISLEIYKEDENQQMQMSQKIPLRDDKDGHFLFNGESSNLVLNDVNGDRIMEILAPTFDRNSVARLNVFVFNPQAGQFEEMTRPNSR